MCILTTLRNRIILNIIKASCIYLTCHTFLLSTQDNYYPEFCVHHSFYFLYSFTKCSYFFNTGNSEKSYKDLFMPALPSQLIWPWEMCLMYHLLIAEKIVFWEIHLGNISMSTLEGISERKGWIGRLRPDGGRIWMAQEEIWILSRWSHSHLVYFKGHGVNWLVLQKGPTGTRKMD